MLFSVKVLIHVHPKELENYFQNMIKIVSSGQAIIAGNGVSMKQFRLVS